MQKEKTVTTEVVITNFIDKTWRPLAVTFAVSIGLYGGYVAYSTYASYQEKNAQEELFSLQKKIEKTTESLTKIENSDIQNDAKNIKDKNKNQAKQENKQTPKITKTPEILKEKYGAVLNELQQFIHVQKGKKASLMAAVQVANLAVEYKDYEFAVETLSSVAGVLSDKDIFSGLIRSQLGSALMEQKKYAEAKEQFKKIIDAKDLKSFQPQALLLMGVSHLEAEQFNEAQSVFSRLEQDFPLTSAAGSAKDFKKLVYLKKDK